MFQSGTDYVKISVLNSTFIIWTDDQVLTLSGQGDQEENCCEETFLLHCSFDCLQKT